MKKEYRQNRIRKRLALLTAMTVLATAAPTATYASVDCISESDQVEEIISPDVENTMEDVADLPTLSTEDVVDTTEDVSGEEQNSEPEVPEQVEEIVEVEDQAEVSALSIEERAVTSPSVTVEKLDTDTGDFTIRITGVVLEQGENVIVPTWSAEQQKDLVWYTAVKEGTDYVVRSNLSKHSYNTGTYNVHVYRRSAAGEMNFLVKTAMDAAPSADDVKAVAGADGNSIQITTSGLKTLGIEQAVEFAVWSDANGQDDLKWYQAVKKGAGVWSYTVPLSAHPGTGACNIHTYVKSKTGKMICVNRTKYEVTGPSCASFTAEVTGSKSFRLTATGFSAPFAASSLIMPVWSKPDQSDLVWYTAPKSGDTFVVNSDVSKHKNNTGTYQAHLYVKDPAGNMICIGKTTFKIGYSFSEVKASLNSDQSIAHLSLTGLQTPEAIWEIRFAVWSKENGQDDLHWYSAKNHSGTWEYDLKVADHKSVGEFIVHCYLAKTDGSVVYLGPTSFTVNKETVVSKVTVTNLDANAGRFQVNIETDPSVNDVRAAIWSKSGQLDLHWYFAKKTADGKFTVSMDIKNHNNNYGTYNIHVYSYRNEVPTLVGTTTATLKASNLITIEDVTENSYKVVIRGAEYDGSPAADITCPTWSVTGGQDDLVWYPAKKQADGSFAATIIRSNHLHDGVYITDVYVKNAAGLQKFAGRVTSPELVGAVRAFDAEAREVMRKIIYAVETGGQVYGAQRYDAFTEAYTGSSAETAITIGAGQWFATEARTLLAQIRSSYPTVFAKYDTAGIGYDLDHENWRYYGSDGAGHKTILKGSAKAVAIQNIIKTPEGIFVQDSLIDEKMAKYVSQAEALGVTDLKAKLFCANIQHLGGSAAMTRVVNYCKNAGVPITMENMWNLMRANEAGAGNKVGSDVYASRHKKVMQWLNTYL